MQQETQQEEGFSARGGPASGGNVRYDIRTPDFVISHDGGVASSPAPWIIRDGPGMHVDKTDLAKYFHELCTIFAKQIKEFEALRLQATKAEQKRLETLLSLTLEAQALLYEDEDA
jgi:hypothetical protein